MTSDSIDGERIINNEHVPDEYFCHICKHLLWKPISCSSCQHLFCEKCLRTWLQNTNNANKCPFRCQPFEERRCPPYVHSILSKLTIRCRNSSFECNQLVPVSKFAEHQQSAELCILQPIRCTICQNYFSKPVFQAHFHQCSEELINAFLERTRQHQILQMMINGQEASNNQGATKGVDSVRRVEQQGYGRLCHVLVMLKFTMMNWSKAPFVILTTSAAGFVACLLFVFELLSYLVSYTTLLSIEYMSDTNLIGCFALLMLVFGCSCQAEFELLEANYFINKQILCTIICGVSILSIKIVLLSIRFYYWSLSIYLAQFTFTFIVFNLAYKAHNTYAASIALSAAIPPP
ncbi:hypothetical protein I4U23_019929 [Adineta vaga]|nr:hypothetical protein I4U23_019929 [Adineta vaga]